MAVRPIQVLPIGWGTRKHSNGTQVCTLRPGLICTSITRFSLYVHVRCLKGGWRFPVQLNVSIEPRDISVCQLGYVSNHLSVLTTKLKIGLPAVPAGRLSWHLVRSPVCVFFKFQLASTSPLPDFPSDYNYGFQADLCTARRQVAPSPLCW